MQCSAVAVQCGAMKFSAACNAVAVQCGGSAMQWQCSVVLYNEVQLWCVLQRSALHLPHGTSLYPHHINSLQIIVLVQVLMVVVLMVPGGGVGGTNALPGVWANAGPAVATHGGQRLLEHLEPAGGWPSPHRTASQVHCTMLY